MLIEKLQNGYELHLPTSGGKAGKGCNYTSSIQIRRDHVIVRQFRFVMDSKESQKRAVAKAKAFLVAEKAIV